MPKKVDEPVEPKDTTAEPEDDAGTPGQVSRLAHLTSDSPALARCNVPGCHEHPETRGLCAAHFQTHRGLAGPKEKP